MLRLNNAFLCLAVVPAMAIAQNSGGIDLLNFATGDAQMLAGANITTARNSPFGQFVLSQMQSGDSHFQTFITQTGFDPRTDLSEVLLSSTSAPGNSSNWLIAAHGSFSQAMATVEGALAADGATVTHLAGVDVINLPGGGATVGTCLAFFTDGHTAVMGDCVKVSAAAQSKGATSSVSSALAAKARLWRNQSDLWFTSVLPLSQFGGALPASEPLGAVMNTGLFKGIQQTSGGVKLASSGSQGPAIQASGEVDMDSPQNASALVNVVSFITGMIQTAKTSDPAATMFTSLLSGLQVSASGNTVNINLTVPEGTLEQLFTSSHHSAILK